MDTRWAPDGRDPDFVSNARLLRLTKGHTYCVPRFISTTRRRKELLTGPVPSRGSPRGGEGGRQRWWAACPDAESQDAHSEPQLARARTLQLLFQHHYQRHARHGFAWCGLFENDSDVFDITG